MKAIFRTCIEIMHQNEKLAVVKIDADYEVWTLNHVKHDDENNVTAHYKMVYRTEDLNDAVDEYLRLKRKSDD